MTVHSSITTVLVLRFKFTQMLPNLPPPGPSVSYRRRFPLQCHDGVVREGGKALAHGLMLAYGELPHENVAFVGCHDNLTSFDSVGSPLPLSSPLLPPLPSLSLRSPPLPSVGSPVLSPPP